MKLFKDIRSLLFWVLLLTGCTLLAVAIGAPRTSGDTDQAARHLTRSLERRMALLDSYADRALAQGPDQWLDLKGLPQDMVVYRYSADTLQSWAGEFPVFNDDLSSKYVFQNLATQRNSLVSPLSAVTDSVSFVNLGPSWYLVSSRSNDKCKVIAGLEVVSTLKRGTFNGVNARLSLGERYSINPLDYDQGSPVYLGGLPQFKVCYDFLSGGQTADPLMIWISIAFLLACGLIFLSKRKTVGRLLIFLAWVLLLMVPLYFWGRSAQNTMSIFSPILYAGDAVLYSLGAVVIINMTVLLVCLSLFMVREDITSRLRTRGSTLTLGLTVIAALALLLVYTHAALSSIITDSDITLELYKLSDLSVYSGVVYASFVSMLMGIPLLLQLLRPVLRNLFNIEFDAFSRTGRVIFAVLMSGCLLLVTGVHGFQTESRRLEVLANRLAIDRDISLELRLKMVEADIASDKIISTLSVFDNTSGSILNRITDLYLGRINQEYSISVLALNKDNSTPEAEDFFNSKVYGGIPIADNTHFQYINNGTGHSFYSGVFVYFNEGQGYSRVLVTVDGTPARDTKGYSAVLGTAPPGAVTIPSGYSFARYDKRDLQYCNGSFSYVTRMDDRFAQQTYEDKASHVRSEGYTHFLNRISDGETVVISRPSVKLFDFFLSFLVMGLALFLILSLLTWRHRASEEAFERNYYKTRIAAVLLVSLVLTLVVMALVSVLFVYSRNDSNRRSIMADKLNSILSYVEPGVRKAYTTRELAGPELRPLFDGAATSTRSDITVFTPQGSMLFSTVPVLYERMMLKTRMNGSAFNGITGQRKRYLIQRERIGRHRYYSMYAPLIGADGNLIGILCSPYTDNSYGFEEDAVSHSLAVLSVFLFLLLLARFMANKVLGKLFRPLSVLGKKIDATNLDSLDLIEYSRDDEVQSLVKAYNRMVTELSDNSRKLAQAERDKAWSGMARQVAHEIKNPLTPMKLQLQRVIRLKQKGDPQWQVRFDEASKVLLDHIDILTETANEFSTFAKLYSEEPTDINLDLLLQEEISMFDSREDVKFEYLGLSDAHINGPKPQLTRVFVNLLSNAVQALEEAGGGNVTVQLRNAGDEGFYEIVVEDDGPGVSSENLDKLFTPNFTTKSSGSGLGLAISRSILERCGASISYSRSFTLGGACFTVRYPK